MINDIAFAAAVAINAGLGTVLAITARGSNLTDVLPPREYATGQIQRRDQPRHVLAIAPPTRYRGKHRGPTETDLTRDEAAL